MAEIANRKALETTGDATETEENSEGLRLAQGRFLDELPGAAFAAVTLIWVISSFAGLFWRNLPTDFITHVHAFSQLAVGSHAATIGSACDSVGQQIYDFVSRYLG